MPLTLGLEATPEFDASLAAAVAETTAAKKAVEALSASARAAAVALASRVDAPQEGLSRFLVRSDRRHLPGAAGALRR